MLLYRSMEMEMLHTEDDNHGDERLGDKSYHPPQYHQGEREFPENEITIRSYYFIHQPSKAQIVEKQIHK
jgi:hypothetical protein